MLKEFGQDLKFLRESKNITIAEISAETRINPKFFINFESGDFNFQPETYIRAFLKEYTRCIGEDETQVLYDYEKAKSGLYERKFVVNQNVPETPSMQAPEEAFSDFVGTQPEIKGESGRSSSRETDSQGTWGQSKSESGMRYGYVDSTDYDTLKSNQRKRLRQKVFIGIIILVIAAGIIFLINYLNKTSGHKQSSDVKPKSFDEMSEDYETKMKGKTEKEIADSIKNLNSVIKSDSLILTVKASKEVRIKVYLDENHLTEETIPAGDSLFLKAKDQFRFSATSGASIDLLLNGIPLQKPKTLLGASVKNLIIRKEGIVTQ